MSLEMVVMMTIVFLHVELLLLVNAWWKTPSHGAKKSHNVYIDIQFWTSVASLFQQTPPWKSTSTDSFDKVNHVQGHSGFSVLPVSQSVFQCSGAVLIEVKGPINVESIWNGKKPGCLPWTEKDFYEFHRKVWSANFLLILSSCQMCRVWDILNILLKNLEFNLPQSKIMKQQETHHIV